MQRCLVVDESDVTRKVVRVILTSLGYVIAEAKTGEAALAMCEDEMPDAILINWDLSDMSGFDFLIAFRHRFDGVKTHIVYATTENDPVDISRALRAGATEFLLLPFERADIEAKFAQKLSAA